VGRLLAAGDLGRDDALLERALEARADPLDEVRVALAQVAEPVDDALAGLGVEFREGEILQLGLDVLHPDPLGQRGVDLHRLGGDPPALLRALDEAQRAHVVQAVGELHQQHADVVRHREQQLAEVLGLGRLRRLELQLVQLGHAVD
jgi:hypothetical protein